jgi:hypothetical protein
VQSYVTPTYQEKTPVADPRDKFDADSLPDPELNPLLNPVLAAHMGRWAEVYFTNPPEKRGQAVSELLRELRNNAPVEPAAVEPIQKEKREEGIRIAEDCAKQIPTVEPPQICSACSAANAAEQKFCGMCGAPLDSLPLQVESKFGVLRSSSEANWNEAESPMENYSAEYATDAAPTSRYVHQHAFEPEWSISETELPHFAQESESVPYRYRVYIGIALAALLGVLIYVGWHGTAGFSGEASESKPTRAMPAAPASGSTAAPQPAPTRNVLPTDRPAETPPAPAVRNQQQSEASSLAAGISQKDRAPHPSPRSPRIVQVAAGSSIANEQSGAEELATAEKYLSGNNQGAAGDNREAAQWLWKAVGKGNLAATMVLSDLYLRGDGVPKSCDQARLLLDAAAKKGKASAAERLRNLQAFGCQ